MAMVPVSKVRFEPLAKPKKVNTMKINIMKNIFLVTCVSSALCVTTNAAVLATPTFDTDSYIFFKTNNAFGPQTTLGQSQQGTPGHPHFNFGVIEFDVSSLSTTGNKYLQLSSIEYVTGQPPSQTVSATGAATVQLVALGASWADYQAAANGQTWYDTNVQNGSVTVLGTFSFTDQSTRHVDVTSTVNGWINNGATNMGFALFSTSGGVEIGSVENTDATLRPALVDVVPEPSSSALAAMGSILLLLRRRR